MIFSWSVADIEKLLNGTSLLVQQVPQRQGGGRAAAGRHQGGGRPATGRRQASIRSAPGRPGGTRTGSVSRGTSSCDEREREGRCVWTIERQTSKTKIQT